MRLKLRIPQCGPLAGLALFLLFVVVVPLTAADETPDLSGRWILNEEESDNPSQKMSRGGGFGRGMGGGRDGGPGAGGMGGGGSPGRGGGTMREMRDPSRVRELVISQGEARLTVGFADDSEQVFYIDGRETDAAGAPIRTSARWKRDKLVIVRQGQRGTMTETWELVADGLQLFVKTKMKGSPGGSMSFERVYDRADESVAAASPEESD